MRIFSVSCISEISGFLSRFCHRDCSVTFKINKHTSTMRIVPASACHHGIGRSASNWFEMQNLSSEGPQGSAVTLNPNLSTSIGLFFVSVTTNKRHHHHRQFLWERHIWECVLLLDCVLTRFCSSRKAIVVKDFCYNATPKTPRKREYLALFLCFVLCNRSDNSDPLYGIIYCS